MAQKKTRFLWRGADRGRLRKLLHALTMLQDRDARMSQVDNTRDDVVIFYFAEDIADSTSLAMETLAQRVGTLLLEKQ